MKTYLVFREKVRNKPDVENKGCNGKMRKKREMIKCKEKNKKHCIKTIRNQNLRKLRVSEFPRVILRDFVIYINLKQFLE